MLELFKKISNIRLSRQNQIIIAVLALCLLIYFLSSSLMNLNNNVGNLKKENAITISRIEFLAAIGEQEISSKSAFSSNFASSVNSSAKDNKLKIDRTLPLSNNEISITFSLLATPAATTNFFNALGVYPLLLKPAIVGILGSSQPDT